MENPEPEKEEDITQINKSEYLNKIFLENNQENLPVNTCAYAHMLSRSHVFSTKAKAVLINRLNSSKMM